MTHTHASRRWAMGTVALAASTANPEVEELRERKEEPVEKTMAADRRSSDRHRRDRDTRDRLQRRWLLGAGMK